MLRLGSERPSRGSLRMCRDRVGRQRTDGQTDLLLLVGQAIVVVQVKEPLSPPVSQELWLQTEEHAEVALTAHHPDGEPRGLQEAADLDKGDRAGRDA